jgi:hypothetical protein
MIDASRKAVERYRFSSFAVWSEVDIACQRKSRHHNLMRGDEPYELRWDPKIVPNHRATLGRNLVLWSYYASYNALYSKSRQYVNSEDTPRWVESAADRFHTLRSTPVVARRANKDKRS